MSTARGDVCPVWGGKAPRVMRVLRTVPLLAAVAAFALLLLLPSVLESGGSLEIIDLSRYPSGVHAPDDFLSPYFPETASLEVRHDWTGGGTRLSVRLSDPVRHAGFGLTTLGGVPAGSMLSVEWRSEGEASSVQVDLREEEDGSGQPARIYSRVLTLPSPEWSRVTLPLDRFRFNQNIGRDEESPPELIDARRLEAVMFTFSPGTDLEFEIRDIGFVWSGYSQACLALLFWMGVTGLGLYVGGRRRRSRGDGTDGAFTPLSTINYVLVSAATLHAIHAQTQWVPLDHAVFFGVLFLITLFDDAASRWSVAFRFLRMRYLVVAAAGWMTVSPLPGASWVLLLLLAYAPAVLARDLPVLLAVAGTALAIFPASSESIPLVWGLGALASTLLPAILALESLRLAAERSRAQRSLTSCRADYRAIFDAVGEGILVADPETGRIVDANRTTRRLLGREEEELARLTLRELIADDRAEVSWTQDGAGEDRSPTALEIRLPCGNRGHLRVEVLIQRFSFDGEERLLVVLRDVERKRLLEERLRQARRLQAVGRLAGGIAHDFNNLLTVVNGRADLALMGLQPHDDLHLDLKEIRDAGARAAKLVAQLLAYSSKQVLQPEVVDISRLLENAGKIVEREAGEKLDLVFDLPATPTTIHADPYQIEQVVLNLIANARDAVSGNGRGKVTVSVSGCDLSPEEAEALGEVPAGRYVLLSVRDDGPGMDGATLDKIFEPFYTSGRFGARSGLGLATVYGIVRQHAGTITVESSPGRGATFRVYLPAWEAAPSEEVNRAEENPSDFDPAMPQPPPDAGTLAPVSGAT